MSATQYFYIELKNLPKEKKVYPFHLYVYNRKNDSYAPFLFANNPMTDTKKQFLEYIVEKGAILAIDYKQKKTFLHFTELLEKDLPGLQHSSQNHLIRAQKLAKGILESRIKEMGNFNFQISFNEAVNKNDFTNLIEWAKCEIMSFSVTISPTVSLAGNLAGTLMNGDNNVNRVVALSYQLAKLMAIMDEEALSDLVCAAFFHHLGLTQLDYEETRKKIVALSGTDRKDYESHPGLSLHILNKSTLELSERTKRIISDHHERADGSGFPSHKKDGEIDQLSLILGAASFIIDYSSGKITGNSEAINSVIRKIESKSMEAGLESSFGDTIVDILIGTIKDTNIKQAA